MKVKEHEEALINYIYHLEYPTYGPILCVNAQLYYFFNTLKTLPLSLEYFSARRNLFRNLVAPKVCGCS